VARTRPGVNRQGRAPRNARQRPTPTVSSARSPATGSPARAVPTDSKNDSAYLVYGGTGGASRGRVTVVGWRAIATLDTC